MLLGNQLMMLLLLPQEFWEFLLRWGIRLNRANKIEIKFVINYENFSVGAVPALTLREGSGGKSLSFSFQARSLQR